MLEKDGCLVMLFGHLDTAVPETIIVVDLFLPLETEKVLKKNSYTSCDFQFSVPGTASGTQ